MHYKNQASMWLCCLLFTACNGDSSSDDAGIESDVVDSGLTDGEVLSDVSLDVVGDVSILPPGTGTCADPFRLEVVGEVLSDPGWRYTGSNAAGLESSDTCGLTGNTGREQVFHLDIPENGLLLVSTDNPGTTYDTALGIRSNCGALLSEMVCANDNGLQNSSASMVGLNVNSAMNIDIVVDAVGSVTGDFELTARFFEGASVSYGGADSCGSASPIAFVGNGATRYGVAAGDTLDTSPTQLQGSCETGSADGPEQVHAITLSQPGTLKVLLEPLGGFDGVVYLVDGCGGSANESVCADAGGDGVNESFSVSLSSGTHYLVVDGASATDFGEYRLFLQLD